MIDFEFCEPFEVTFLKEFGGKSWGMKYMLGSNSIKEELAKAELNSRFNESLSKKPHFFELKQQNNDSVSDANGDANISNEETFEVEEKIEIMGTFQTIKFKNETDESRGLEPLVNKNFFSLFQHFTEDKTILISENRLFHTEYLKDKNNNIITGIKTVPDALLISFDIKKIKKSPIKINLIEYECYGESKLRTSEKNQYFEWHCNTTIDEICFYI